METKNMFETFADMQKQAVETFTNAAESMKGAIGSNGNVDFNSDFFKKWYDSQMAWFNQNKGENGNQAFEFFQNWMKNQNDLAKTWFEKSQDMMKTMPAMNANNTDWNTNYSNTMNMFNSWKDSMSSAYNDMLGHFNNDANREAFTNMYSNSEMYMKMFQFWMPVMKSLQDKTFTPEIFKQMFNAPLFKDIMDNMFKMPDFMKNLTENPMMDSMKGNMNQFMDSNKNMFDNMKNMMNQNMSSIMPEDFFTKMIEQYNGFNNQFNNAIAPLTKLMPNGNQKQQMETMKAMSEHMNLYNIKNSQMQYMMYTTGMKAMDELAENIYGKMRSGEDMSKFTNIYQEWLNTNDRHFVNLFDSEEYSKLMSEVSTLQLGLKKQIELQMEKAMAHLPVVNRTEMDDLYKTIYELKKRVNMLEKQIDADQPVAETATEEVKESKPKRAAKTSA